MRLGGGGGGRERRQLVGQNREKDKQTIIQRERDVGEKRKREVERGQRQTETETKKEAATVKSDRDRDRDRGSDSLVRQKFNVQKKRRKLKKRESYDEKSRFFRSHFGKTTEDGRQTVYWSCARQCLTQTRGNSIWVPIVVGRGRGQGGRV